MDAQEMQNQVERFLSLLFEPSDLVEVRLLPAGRKIFHVMREWPQHLEELTRANEQGGQDVYIGINPRMREGGKIEDVAAARCVCADFDDVEADNAADWIAAKGLPTPTLILHSGHGVHAYWRLVEAIDSVDTVWRAAQVAIAEKYGSDRKCQDPPRVMRLPGFLNLPDARKGETEAVPARILSVQAEAVYRIQEIVGDLQPVSNSALLPQLSPMPVSSLDRNNRLSRSTLQFCFDGAIQGERQTKCFHAACDMAGNGFSVEETESRLLPPATRCGLPEPEARQAIRSAFSRSRNPSVPVGMHDEDPVGSAFQHSSGTAVAIMEEPKPLQPQTKSIKAITPHQATDAGLLIGPAEMRDIANARRLQVSNVIDTSYKDTEGNDVPCRYHIPVPDIAASISEATGGWPRRAGGMVFAVNPQQDVLPNANWIQIIGNADDLFAWVGKTCNVRWAAGDAIHHETKKKLNPPTKREMFAYLKDNASPSYRAVEVLPHHPSVPDVFYLPCKLPPVPDLEVSPLQELINRLNPETELDRLLMRAALFTPGWGGPPGTRPMFVFTTKHGTGAGKTATANVIADVWGGKIGIGGEEDVEMIKKRLINGDAIDKRVAIIDNKKGKLSGGDLEGLITERTIEGWRLHAGNASRPNLLTWMLTSNMAQLSRDMADRCVVIEIGPKNYNVSFETWATEFVARNRGEILAEIFDSLRQPPLISISNENRDRWSAWQDAILTRWDDGDDAAALIKQRRTEVDSELDEAGDVAASVVRLISIEYPDYDERNIHISYQQLYDQLVKDEVTDRAFGPRKTISWIKKMCGYGAMKRMKEHKTNARRGWLFSGEQTGQNDRIDHLMKGDLL